MKNKVCKVCLVEQPEDSFYLQKKKRITFRLNECKTCTAKKYHEKYWESRKEKKVENLESEIWFDLKGFEGYYRISNFLRIKSVPKEMWVEKRNFYRHYDERLVSTNPAGRGYLYGNFYTGGKRKLCSIHRVIANHFIPNPKSKLYINHKNGIKTDNSLDNLEWTTSKENSDHKWNVLKCRLPKGKDHKLSKPVLITFPDGEEKNVFSITEAAEFIDTYSSTISQAIIKNRPYRGYKFKLAV